MNNFFSLVKVEFLSQFGLNKILHSKKDKRLSGMSGLCIFERRDRIFRRFRKILQKAE